LVSTRELDDTLAQVAGARDYSLEQVTPREYRLLLVAEGNKAAASQAAEALLAALYGPGAQVKVELQADLEPAPSGKYRRTRTLFDYDVEGLFA
jgi:hypothetical protein